MNKRLYFPLIVTGLFTIALGAAEPQTYKIRTEYEQLGTLIKDESQELSDRYPTLTTDAVIYFREYMRTYQPHSYMAKDAETLIVEALDFMAKKDRVNSISVGPYSAPIFNGMIMRALEKMGYHFSNLLLVVDRNPLSTEILHDTTPGGDAWLYIGAGLINQLSDQELIALIGRSVIDNRFRKPYPLFGTNESPAKETVLKIVGAIGIMYIGSVYVLASGALVFKLAEFYGLNRYADEPKILALWAGTQLALAAGATRISQWLTSLARQRCYEKDAQAIECLGKTNLLNALRKQAPTKADATRQAAVDRDLARLEFERLKKVAASFASTYPEVGQELTVAIDVVQSELGAIEPSTLRSFFRSFRSHPSLGERIVSIKRRQRSATA